MVDTTSNFRFNVLALSRSFKASNIRKFLAGGEHLKRHRNNAITYELLHVELTNSSIRLNPTTVCFARPFLILSQDLLMSCLHSGGLGYSVVYVL